MTLENKAMFEKRFDFDEYSVVLTNYSIKYIFRETEEVPEMSYFLPVLSFNNSIDDEKYGGKIEINFTDRWGSSYRFVHYQPSDLKGMFDFIGRGYRLKIIK